MEIIRSCGFMVKMQIKDKLVKRGFQFYVPLLHNLCDERIEADYWRAVKDNPKMSRNRIAYNVLKRYYSTTAINHLILLGGWSDAL